MTAQDLKNAILQLAVQGKLVEQRSEEGSAEGLFKEILQEKINGLCYKEPSIADEEIPFDIPETWKWVRINNIAVLYNGRAYSKEELKEEGKYPVLRVGNLFTSRQWYYSDLELEEDKYCKAGDLLYAWSASFGPHIWDGCKAIYHYHIWKIVHSSHVFQKYLYYYLLADTERIKQSGHGLAMIHVTKAGTEQRLIPLPPFAEQYRIVEKIEELLPLVEEYGKAEERLTALNAKFPDKLRKSILQQAIQGKLTERDPADEPASELLKRIRAEKERLIKEGKIKKEKPLPAITDDEKPFDIPESWMWCYTGDLFQHNTGKALNASNKSGITMTYITTSNLYWDRFELDNLKEMPFTEAEVEKCTVKKGDLLVCEGGDYARSAIWPYDYPMRIQNHIHRLRAYGPLSIRYFYYVFYLYKNTGLIAGKGIAIQGLSSNALHTLKMPLPPLAEQQRIVDRVNELLAVCDELIGG